MPHGTPDWGHVGPLSVLYGLDDLGEHAVRVGAVSSWDRKGHVIFQDNFKEGLGAWRLRPSSADAVLCPFTGEAVSPPYCVKMVNGSEDGEYAILQHSLSYLYRGATGFEFNIAYGEDIEYVIFGIHSRSPINRQHFYVRFTPLTGDFEHGSDAAGWLPVENVGAMVSEIWQWHNVKLVADTLTGFFVKLVWEGVPIDMSAIPCVTAVAATPYYWNVFVQVDSTDATQYELRLDDVIVTIDEP